MSLKATPIDKINQRRAQYRESKQRQRSKAPAWEREKSRVQKSEYRAAHPEYVAKETQRKAAKRQLIKIKDRKADLKALGKAMERKLKKKVFRD